MKVEANNFILKVDAHFLPQDVLKSWTLKILQAVFG